MLEPGGVHQLLFLHLAGGGDVFGQGALGLLLIAGHDGELDVVAVLGLGVAQLAGDLAHAVALDLAVALAQVAVLRQPVLHGGLDAVHADGVGVLVALFLELQPLFGRGNRAHVADHLRGQRAARVDALGAHGDFHARQRHGAGFDLDDGFIRHVLGDHDGLGVEEVHLHFGVDGHDLEHGFLIQHHVLDVRRRVGAGGPARVGLLLRVCDLVSLLELIEAAFRGGIAGSAQVGHVVVAAPLVFARLQDRFAHPAAEVEDPLVRLRVALDHEVHVQLVAVSLDDLHRLHDALRQLAVLRGGILARVAVEGHVVDVRVPRQDDRVRVGDHAAAAAQGDGGGAAALGAVRILLALHHLQAEYARQQIRKHPQRDDQKYQIPGPQVVPLTAPRVPDAS